MSYDLEPVVGHWYRLVEKGDVFRVVSVDADDDTIAVRWFEGDREELDSGGWFELDLEETEAPEGWTDSGEDIPEDDEEEAAPRKGRAAHGEDERPRDWDDDDEDDEDEDDDEDDDWDDDESDDR